MTGEVPELRLSQELVSGFHRLVGQFAPDEYMCPVVPACDHLKPGGILSIWILCPVCVPLVTCDIIACEERGVQGRKKAKEIKSCIS